MDAGQQVYGHQHFRHDKAADDGAGKGSSVDPRSLRQQPGVEDEDREADGKENCNHEDLVDLFLCFGGWIGHLGTIHDYIHSGDIKGLVSRRTATGMTPGGNQGPGCTVAIIKSWFAWSSWAIPQAVELPEASNLHPHIELVWAPHWPLSRLATQKPEPTGRFRGFPAPLTAIRSSPLPVAPLLHVKVPEVLLNRTLSLASQASVAWST